MYQVNIYVFQKKKKKKAPVLKDSAGQDHKFVVFYAFACLCFYGAGGRISPWMREALRFTFYPLLWLLLFFGSVLIYACNFSNLSVLVIWRQKAGARRLWRNRNTDPQFMLIITPPSLHQSNNEIMLALH